VSAGQLDAKGRALNAEFQKVATKFSVDPALLKAVARAESCFDPSAVSRAGAKGLMQLMPTTAKAMGVTNILDPQQNLLGGAQYLAAMLARYSSDTHLALAAYNAGPGNVDKYNGVPPFNETRRYIKSVTKFHQDFAPQFQEYQ
jgi:soluble lytic murein transglycosylase-like protein